MSAMTPSSSPNPLMAPQKVADAVARGAKTQSYKFVTWLALLTVLSRNTSEHGVPAVLDANEVADEVLAIYWRQTRPYKGQLLVHTRQRGRSLLEHTDELQKALGLAPRTDVSVHLRKADTSTRKALLRLRTRVRNVICSQALPRLQVIAGVHDPFLFDVWEAHPGGNTSQWPDTQSRELYLRRGAARVVLDASRLLVPLIQSSLLAFVTANSPQTPDEGLVEQTLFGVDRIALQRVRVPIGELHDGRCFSCRSKLGSKFDIDHFLPWSWADGDADMGGVGGRNVWVSSATKVSVISPAPRGPQQVRRWLGRPPAHRVRLARSGRAPHRHRRGWGRPHRVARAPVVDLVGGI